MARSFKHLERNMSPERIARSDEMARRMMAGMLIAELRRHSGKTQTQLAHLIGVKQPVISRMEMQDDLRLSTLQAIINALGGSMRITVQLPGGKIEVPAVAYEGTARSDVRRPRINKSERRSENRRRDKTMPLSSRQLTASAA
jgi:DNA-binding XRE family transcriptional regulator